MFLLARAQLGPAPLLRFGARYKKKRSAYYVPGGGGQGQKGKPAVIQRDAMGRPIVKQREKSLGTFRPLPPTALGHELFETEAPGRVELDLPLVQPRLLAPGVAMRFHDLDPSSPFRVYGVPKHMVLEFRTLGVPASITTSTTLSLIRAIEESRDRPARLVLNGRPGVGKSFLLLQAAEYAAATGEWIVLYIPRAKRFVDGSTPYQYSLATRTYLQPRAAVNTLSRLLRANSHILSEMETQADIVLPDGGPSFSAGTPLTKLIDAGVEGEAVLAPFVLEAVMQELGTQDDFPVLIAIDDFQALAGRSLYRDPRFKTIRPHHLSMPRLLLEYAAGRKKLASGLVLTALSRSDTQFPVPHQLADALRLPDYFTPTPRSVRYRRSVQLAAYLENEVEEVEEPEPELEPIAMPNEELDTSKPDAELAVSESGADAELAASTDADPELAAFDSDADADSDAESSDVEDEPAWTGYTAYDPLSYEDSMRATASDPFPVPGPADLWKEMVVPRDEEGGDKSLGALEDVEEDWEGEDPVEASAPADFEVVQQQQKKKKKKKQPKMVRALRAVRVPDSLSIREAVGLFEMWLDAGVLRTGGERRALRRAELETRDEYRAVKAEVDADRETAYDEELAEADQDPSALSPFSTQAILPPPKRAAPKSSPFNAFASTVQATTFAKGAANASQATEGQSEREGEHTIAALRRELAGEEYDEVAVLEAAAGAERWAARRQIQDAQIWSLDAERERQLAEAEAEEADESDESGAESEGEMEEGIESMEGIEHEADGIESAGEDLVRAAEALADASEVSANDSDLESDSDADADSDSYALGPLDLGDDLDIARIVSAGVRGALHHPEAVADLLRAPTSLHDASSGGWTETGVFRSTQNAAQGWDDEQGGAYGEMKEDEDGDEDEDDEDGLVEEEAGADELFLGKYTESSGNPRVFVAGLLGTLQTHG